MIRTTKVVEVTIDNLMAAVDRGDVRQVKNLIDRDADVNEKAPDG